MASTDIISLEQLKTVLNGVGVKLLFFHSKTSPQSTTLDSIITEYVNEFEGIHLLKVDCDVTKSIATYFNIKLLPTTIVFTNQKIVSKIDGYNPIDLYTHVSKAHADQHLVPTSTQLNIVNFIQGLETELDHFGNISIVNRSLSEKYNDFEELLSVLLASSNPTDKQKVENSIDAAITNIISKYRVLLFIKGQKQKPYCKFSKEIISIMNSLNADYVTFDVFQSEFVKERIKKISSWPTFPQLYIKSELVGGVDIVRDMNSDSSLKELLHFGTANESSKDSISNELNLDARIKNLIDSNRVMLFMKGTPQTPRCGFSKEIVVILNKYCEDYGHFDILEDNQLRQAIKVFSDWPTYPQLYIDGEFVGGLDIVKELDASNDLKPMF